MLIPKTLYMTFEMRCINASGRIEGMNILCGRRRYFTKFSHFYVGSTRLSQEIHERHTILIHFVHSSYHNNSCDKYRSMHHFQLKPPSNFLLPDSCLCHWYIPMSKPCHISSILRLASPAVIVHDSFKKLWNLRSS